MSKLKNLYIYREFSPSVPLRWPLWPWGSTCTLCGVRWSAGSWLSPPWFWFPATPSTCSAPPAEALNRCRSLKSSLSRDLPSPLILWIIFDVQLTLILLSSVLSSDGGRWPPPSRTKSRQGMKNSHTWPAWAKLPCSLDCSCRNNLSFSLSCCNPLCLDSAYFPVKPREAKGALMSL